MADRRYLPHRQSAGLAARLLGSGMIAQAAVLLATAFAASRMTPDDFSNYGVVSGGTAVLVTFNTLAAESRSAVVHAPDAAALTRAGFTATNVFFALCTAAGTIALIAGASWATLVLLIGACSLTIGAQQLLTGLVLREQRQQLLAANRLYQGLSNAVFIVALMFAPVPGYMALCLAWWLSTVIGDIVLIRGLKPTPIHFQLMRQKDLTILHHEVRFQPLANLLAGSVASLPLLLLPVLGASRESGAWALASRFITPIVTTAYNTLQPIYYARSAAFIREGHWESFRDYHARWVILLGVMSIGFGGATYVALNDILPMLGDEWVVLQVVATPALVFFTSLFWCVPISQTLLLQGRVHTQFWWTVARFTLCLAPLLLLAGRPADALMGWAIFSAATFIAQLWLHRHGPGHHRAPDTSPKCS